MLQKVDGAQANIKLEQVINRLRAGVPVRCLDVETSGLDWKRNHIVGYAVAFGPDPRDSYYLPFRHAAGANVEGHGGPQTVDGWDGAVGPAERALVALLAQGGLCFGHNLAFDLKFLHRVGFPLDHCRFEDTIINAPLLDEWQGKFSLEFCAGVERVLAKRSAEMAEHICQSFPEATPKNAMGHFWRLAGDDGVAVTYAEGDGTTTWQLRDKQEPQIDAQELRQVHDVESRLIPVLVRMTIKGIRIDEERLDWLKRYAERRVEELASGFPPDFNPISPSQVQKWCSDHGQTDWPLTPKGKPSFPEAWLETHDPGRKIIETRKIKNLLNSFIRPMMETHLYNGRVHTDFNQLRGDQYGTVTGRLSSSNPNLQQVPKHNRAMGELFRSIFIPDDSMIWGSVDFSQAEPRLLAWYANCRVLLDGYKADPPVDAHTAVAIACNPTWSDMTPDAQKEARQLGKRINQTLITGGGGGVLVSKYKVPANEVQGIMRTYFERMPEIKALQHRASDKMLQRGHVYSLLGRRARLINTNKAYTAVNRLLQCGNADIIKLAMVRIDDYLASVGRPIDVLNNVHDALDFQFSRDHRKEYAECLSIMRSTQIGRVKLPIPMEVDANEGVNWAAATYGVNK